jgi:Skp family chaperone for outer membrane proteins
MRRTLSVALPLGLAIGLAVAALVRPAGAADPVVGRVAVVDVLQVINESPAKARIDANFKAKQMEITKFAREERDRLENEATQIEILTRTDPTRRDRERNLNRSKVVSEFDLKARVADAQKEYFDALENLWREVRAEVRNVAKEGGYAIVVTKTEDELNARSNEEFVINVAVRNVLYYESSVDITSTVKARMAARPVPGGPPPTPPPPGGPPGGGGRPPNTGPGVPPAAPPSGRQPGGPPPPTPTPTPTPTPGPR